MDIEITAEQQEHLDELIDSGDKLEAIRYAQQELSLEAEQAISFVERLEAMHEGKLDAELAQAGNELEKSVSNLPRIIGGIFGMVGIILIGLACFFGYRSYTFLKTAVSVPGVVKEFKKGQYKDKETRTMVEVVMPVLQYHYDGKNYIYVSPYSTTEPQHNVGDQIPLLINPNDPSQPDEDTFMEKWFVTILLGSIGLVFAGVGLIVIRAFNRP